MSDVLVNSSRPGDGDDGATVTVTLRGNIDAATTATLRHALVEVIVRRRYRRIVVDLRQTTAIDPVAIGTLMAAYHTARDMRLSLVFQDEPTGAGHAAASPGHLQGPASPGRARGGGGGPQAGDLVAVLVRDVQAAAGHHHDHHQVAWPLATGRHVRDDPRPRAGRVDGGPGHHICARLAR